MMLTCGHHVDMHTHTHTQLGREKKEGGREREISGHKENNNLREKQSKTNLRRKL